MADSSSVATHYNAVPNTGIKERSGSRILHLRNFNNWMKSQLIADFLELLRQEGCPSSTVLDLCCGKGGDLLKWRIGNIKEIVMVDMADVALSHCRERFGRLRGSSGKPPFTAHFISADASKCILRDEFHDKDMKFDICSCQFALHYSFKSEACARQMLQNATESLRPGGYLIGTIPNADMIVKLLRQGDNGTFRNEVCTIEYANKEVDVRAHQPALFGAQLNFHLGEVVDCPEFFCYFPLLIKMLEELDMELVYHYTFPEALQFYLEKNGDEAKDLMARMDALETVDRKNAGEKDTEEYGHVMRKFDEDDEVKRVGMMSKSEWEVVAMYLVFGFRKRCGQKAEKECLEEGSEE